ncbi:putative uncharacterized protein [Burkholderiales bacterium GJ-E10]|nr:putative uncharacterized protein [Burkholderiales bacterium GJ-E10]
MRPVPRLIDDASRIGEYCMAFLVPLFLLRTVDPLIALGAGAVACALTVRCTLGKPEGYLAHRAYRAGINLRGLLDGRLRNLDP